MSDIVVTILIPITAAMAIGLGYAVARLLDLRTQVEVQRQALRALAPPEEPRKKKRHLYAIKGGRLDAILLAPLIAALARARRHPRALAGAAVAAGAVALTAGALLAHGTPPLRHHLTGPAPTASSRFPTSASPAPTPSSTPPAPRPGRTPVPVPLLPVRTRRAAAPTASPTAPGALPSTPRPPAAPPPRPIPAPTSATPPTPIPSSAPAAHCPISLRLRVLRIGVTVCV